MFLLGGHNLQRKYVKRNWGIERPNWKEIGYLYIDLARDPARAKQSPVIFTSISLSIAIKKSIFSLILIKDETTGWSASNEHLILYNSFEHLTSKN